MAPVDPVVAAARKVGRLADAAKAQTQSVPWAIRLKPEDGGAGAPIGGGKNSIVPGRYGPELAPPRSELRDRGIAEVAQAIQDAMAKKGFPVKIQNSHRRIGTDHEGGPCGVQSIELGCKYVDRGKRGEERERNRRGPEESGHSEGSVLLLSEGAALHCAQSLLLARTDMLLVPIRCVCRHIR